MLQVYLQSVRNDVISCMMYTSDVQLHTTVHTRRLRADQITSLKLCRDVDGANCNMSSCATFNVGDVIYAVTDGRDATAPRIDWFCNGVPTATGKSQQFLETFGSYEFKYAII